MSTFLPTIQPRRKLEEDYSLDDDFEETLGRTIGELNSQLDELYDRVTLGSSEVAQPITVQRASVVIGTRATLNFIEGSSLSITITDDVVNERIDITLAVTGVVAHNLLSASHPDTTPASPTDGQLIVSDANLWVRLAAAGAINQVLQETAGGILEWHNDLIIDRVGGGGVTVPGVEIDIENDGSSPNVRQTGWGAVPVFLCQRSAGTKAAPTATASGDSILQLAGAGYDGAAFANGALVRMIADELWSAVAQGTRMTFFTTENGGTSTVEKMRLDHNGRLGVNETNPAGRIHVVGGTASVPVAVLEDDQGDAHVRLVGNSGNAAPTTGDLWREADADVRYFDGALEHQILEKAMSFDAFDGPPSNFSNIPAAWTTVRDWWLPQNSDMPWPPQRIVYLVFAGGTATFSVRVHNVTRGQDIATGVVGITGANARYRGATLGTWPAVSSLDDIEIQVFRTAGAAGNTFIFGGLTLIAYSL